MFRPMRVRRALPLLLCLAVAFGACGGGDSGSSADPTPTTEDKGGPPRPPKKEATVLAKGVKFIPEDVTIAAGGTVTWRMDDGTIPHNVYNDGGDEKFESENIADGKTFSHTFANPGEYDYKCTLHPTMKGTVTVK